jgi:hypothetical protein
LKERLLTPELVAAFVTTFQQELARLNVPVEHHPHHPDDPVDAQVADISSKPGR